MSLQTRFSIFEQIEDINFRLGVVEFEMYLYQKIIRQHLAYGLSFMLVTFYVGLLEILE